MITTSPFQAQGTELQAGATSVNMTTKWFVLMGSDVKGGELSREIELLAMDNDPPEGSEVLTVACPECGSKRQAAPSDTSLICRGCGVTFKT